MELANAVTDASNPVMLFDPAGAYLGSFTGQRAAATFSEEGRITTWSWPYGGASYSNPHQLNAQPSIGLAEATQHEGSTAELFTLHPRGEGVVFGATSASPT